MKRKQIDATELKKVFRIMDGNLERLNLNFRKANWTVVVNRYNNSGNYCNVKFNGRLIMYHSIIWILLTGEDVPDGLQIDHINGNTLDSRIENMRLVTNRVNAQNKRVHRGGQLFGCSFYKPTGKYKAQVKIGERHINLGYYETEKEAHNAYVIACEHIKEYVDNDSFRELVKKEMHTPYKKAN